MDITQLILDDHHEQRRRFALLEQMDSAGVAALSDVWTRLAVFLEVHAAAEEEIFYPELVKLALAPGRSPAPSLRRSTRLTTTTRYGTRSRPFARTGWAAPLARRHRCGQRRERRSHGGGGAGGPDRLPPPGEPAPAP